MKKIIWFLSFLICMGCASVQIPVYLQNKKPYTKRFYSTFDHAMNTTVAALEDLGWVVEHKVDPMVYEQGSLESAEEQRILLLTKVRQTPMFLGTRYAKLNVYIKSLKGVSEIEIRYLTVTSMAFKTFQTYQNDMAAGRIFKRIEEGMNE